MTRPEGETEQDAASAASPWATGEPLPSGVFFDAIIEPYRSLPPQAFRTLMILLVALSLGPIAILVSKGAWPCIGFLGLDVLLLYLAFKTSYRHGRLYERVRLTQSELAVERVWPGGRRQNWTLEPYWARVEVEQRGEHEMKMALVSRGQRVVLGAFLAPEEREKLADALKGALARRLDARIG
jgi:uncharacterized membrane protein